ncbi:MAG: methyltransferase domain-containing protein [Acidobacteria bacterium]|nr:MAG: methyltransferase domain-containing protein [Acidobacteriota bacterium]
MAEHPYLLGHGEREWSRLEEQHRLWRDTLFEPLRRLGIGPGMRVLEVGCGNGVLLADLARLVGRHGRAWGVERDPLAAEAARQRVEKMPQAVVLQGDLFGKLPGPADAVVARWVFSFLGRPAEAVRHLAAALRPDGLLVIQDYDHDGLRLHPRKPAVDRVIEAFRAAYRARGGDLWIGLKLPGHFARAGLELELVEPAVKAGPPGSAPFRWVERFLFEHIDTVVSDGHLAPADRVAFERAWREAAEDPATLLVTPIQLTLAARRRRVGAGPGGAG